ncbi:unnamed protein product [Chrysoparadoxa australica]
MGIAPRRRSFFTLALAAPLWSTAALAPPSNLTGFNLKGSTLAPNAWTTRGRRSYMEMMSEEYAGDGEGRAPSGGGSGDKRLPRMVSWGLNSRSPPSTRKALGSKSKTHITVYVCEVCGSEHVQWVGRCPTCKEWNSVKPFKVPREGGSGLRQSSRAGLRSGEGTKPAARSLDPRAVTSAPSGSFEHDSWVPDGVAGQGLVQRITDVEADEMLQRIELPGTELSRVLGGGLVPGSVAMIGGDPGVGKSTLMLQLAGKLAGTTTGAGLGPIVYVSGEESAAQVASRARRFSIAEPQLYLMSETDIDLITDQLAAMRPLPALVIVDSIQTLCSADIASGPGSISQVKECSGRLVHIAKGLGVAVFLVGHVTKSGDIAGPRTVEHMVDAVLYLEGDSLNSYRLLRSVKNRFGASNEIGVFEMHEGGLKEVVNPSELFLSTASPADAAEEGTNLDGTAVMVTMEGSRPLLCELQALVTFSKLPSPRRTSDGIHLPRLLLLLAVLQKRLGYNMSSREVYLNVVGGLRLHEAASDLAVALVIVSSYTGIPVHRDTCFIGEVGLGGEVRMVQQLERRLQEAAKFGYARVVTPKLPKGSKAKLPSGIEVVQCRSLKHAIDVGLTRRAYPHKYDPKKKGRRQGQDQYQDDRASNQEETEEAEDDEGWGDGWGDAA